MLHGVRTAHGAILWRGTHLHLDAVPDFPLRLRAVRQMAGHRVPLRAFASHALILPSSGDTKVRPTRHLHLEDFPPQGFSVLGSQVNLAACRDFSDHMR